MTRVGIRAAFSKRIGETPFSKYFFKIDWPAGLGALAITVRPPPVTAPAATAYFKAAVKSGTQAA